MTLKTVKPRSAISRVSPSIICVTDLLLVLVMTPSEDCVLSSIRLPFEVRRIAAGAIHYGVRIGARCTREAVFGTCNRAPTADVMPFWRLLLHGRGSLDQLRVTAAWQQGAR